jgi:hypothetical protein
MIKKVAVPALKHSPMLGQEASSQTVFSSKSRKMPLILPTRSHCGALTRNHSGLTATLMTHLLTLLNFIL